MPIARMRRVTGERGKHQLFEHREKLDGALGYIAPAILLLLGLIYYANGTFGAMFDD